MFTKIENFIVRFEKEEDEKFVSALDLKKLYSFTADILNFKRELIVKLYLIYEMPEYYFFSNMKFEKWICGFTDRNGTIFIFAPSVIEQFSDHKKEEIAGVIVHELAHMMQSSVQFLNNRLICEGIATYIMYKFRNKKMEDIDLSKVDLARTDKEIYNQGAKLINKLFEIGKKEELFNMLKENKAITQEMFKQLIST